MCIIHQTSSIKIYIMNIRYNLQVNEMNQFNQIMSDFDELQEYALVGGCEKSAFMFANREHPKEAAAEDAKRHRAPPRRRRDCQRPQTRITSQGGGFSQGQDPQQPQFKAHSRRGRGRAAHRNVSQHARGN